MPATISRDNALRRAVTLSIALIASACTGAEPRSAPPDPARPGETPAPASAAATPPTPVPPPVAPPETAPTPAAPTDVAGGLPPVTLDCDSDADCILSSIEIVDGACCFGCLVHVVNTSWKEQADAFCEAHPGSSCPKKRCGSAPAPKCRAGQCTNDT